MRDEKYKAAVYCRFANEDEPIRAAIYCRLASADEHAMEAQLHNMRSFAQSLGYMDCLEYLDNGFSGLTLDRPVFSQMNNLIRSNQVCAVLVKDLSRIGRNAISVYSWLNEMGRLGVKVVSLNAGELRVSENETNRLHRVLAQTNRF